MEFDSKKEEKLQNRIYFIILVFWASFLVCRFAIAAITKTFSSEGSSSFSYIPIKDTFEVVIAVLTYRFSWESGTYYLFPMSNKSFYHKTPINTIIYSGSHVALMKASKSVFMSSCPTVQIHTLSPCYIDEIFQHYYYFEYAPWLIISHDQFYFSENKLLELLSYLDERFNPMAEKVVVGKATNVTIEFHGATIFSRAFVEFLVNHETPFSISYQENSISYSNQLFNIIKKSNNEIHFFDNPFAIYQYPKVEYWEKIMNLSTNSNISAYKQYIPQCTKISKGFKKKGKNGSLYPMRILARDVVSMVQNPFIRTQVPLTGNIRKLPKQVKIFQESARYSYLCLDNDDSLDTTFDKKSFACFERKL